MRPGAIGGRTLLEIRDARGRLGRAIRAARRRRALAQTTGIAPSLALSTPVVVAPRSRRRAALRAIAALAIMTLLLVFILWPTTQEESGGGLPPTIAVPQPVVVREILRGKSVTLASTPAPVALITPLPQLSASPTPFVERPNEDRIGGTPGGVAGGTGSGTGGSGTGSGGGVGSGTAPGTPKPTPVPTQPPPPAAVPAGYGRLMIIVQDSLSGAVVPDVCLVVGSIDCGPTKPHTDGAGRWWVDVPLSQATTNFDVRFIHPGYTTDFRRFVLLKGQTVTYVVRLQPYQQREAG